MRRILLHDVPKNWLATDLDHRFGLEVRLLADAGAEAPARMTAFIDFLMYFAPPDRQGEGFMAISTGYCRKCANL